MWLVALSGVALAALPKKNSTYAGKVAGKTVTLKVGNTVTKGRVVIDCGASGGKQPAFSVKIKSTGAFSGHGLTAGPGIPPAILKNLHHDPAGAKQVFLPDERPVLAHDHPRDAVEQNGAAAHRARRQGGVQRALAIDVRRPATGTFQRVHLAVQDDTASLHPPIATLPENVSVVHQHGADGNAALGQTELSFLDCSPQELVHDTILSGNFLGAVPRGPTRGRWTGRRSPGVAPRHPSRADRS